MILSAGRPPQITKRAVVYVGLKCDINCSFCYYRNKDQRDFTHFEQILISLKQAWDFYEDRQLDITGGEPTFHPDILKIVQAASKIGFGITIITHGQTLHRKNLAKKLRDAGCEEFLISVHGPAYIHDQLTCENGFMRVMKSLSMLKAMDMPFRVNTVLTKPNSNALDELAKIVINHGAQQINFISFNPYYEWSSVQAEFQAKFTEFKDSLHKALEICRDSKVDANVRYLPYCQISSEFRHLVTGWKTLSYDPHEWDLMQQYGKTSADMCKLFLMGITDHNIREFSKYGPVEITEDGRVNYAPIYRIIWDMWAAIMSQQIHSMWGQCENCLERFRCDGLNRSYAERFGVTELKTIVPEVKPEEEETPDLLCPECAEKIQANGKIEEACPKCSEMTQAVLEKEKADQSFLKIVKGSKDEDSDRSTTQPAGS
ncbi:MAG: radical SAM protein [Proteobacteria bacterium]|nr:radical SAM protein [Pseudomonadota bacterium]